MQLVVGQDEVPQVHQALEVGVIQDGEAVGVQVESVQILEVGEGVRPDLTDGVSAQGQVDLHMQRNRRAHDILLKYWISPVFVYLKPSIPFKLVYDDFIS